MPVCTSTINAVELPIQFRYTPPVPSRRYSETPTASGIVIQRAPTLFVEDTLLAWRMEAVTEAQKDAMLAYYEDASAPNLTFIGHNEPSKTYQVKALQMDSMEITGGKWTLSGSFKVISVA